MATNHTHGNHVWMFEDMESRPSEILDATLGSLNAIASAIGLFGNFLTFGYFVGKHDLASKLYSHMCCINIVLCFSQASVIFSLLDERKPGIFAHSMFCSIWDIIRHSLGRLYSFTVLLLSTSRTIAILYPLYKIKKHLVIGTLYVLVIFLGLQEIGKHLVGISAVYGADGPYCYNFYDTTKDGFTTLQKHFDSFKLALESVGLAAPVLSSIVSLILIPRKLLSSPPSSLRGEQQQNQQQRQRKATTTVVVFTGAFLLFYMPVFLTVSLLTIDNIIFGSGPVIFSHPFMFWYSWPLCELCNALNALVDFLVYLTRIKGFRLWLIEEGRKINSLFS